MNRRDVLSGAAVGLTLGGGFLISYETPWEPRTPDPVTWLDIESKDSPRPGNEGGPEYYAEQPPSVTVNRDTNTVSITGYLYVGSVDHDLTAKTLSYDVATEELTIEMAGYLPLQTRLDSLALHDRISRRSYHSYEVIIEMITLPSRITATEIPADEKELTTTVNV